MAGKKKARLGKGLGALLGDVKKTTAAEPKTEEQSPISGEQLKTPQQDQPANEAGLRVVPIDLLQRGRYQPRLKMDKEVLQELADSIKSQGVIQPLLARPNGDGLYEIIAGERRWRAAQLAGLNEVPVVVRDMEDQDVMAVALIENIQRQDLNAIEEAKGFARLMDEFGLTHQEIAEVVGRSRVAVSNLLRLLNLHASVMKMVENGELDMGHARALLSLPEEKQPLAARQISREGLSVRKAELLVKRMASQKAASAKVPKRKSADVQHLEEELSKRVGAKVVIEQGAKKGRLIIEYHSLDELDGILGRIK